MEANNLRKGHNVRRRRRNRLRIQLVILTIILLVLAVFYVLPTYLLFSISSLQLPTTTTRSTTISHDDSMMMECSSSSTPADECSQRLWEMKAKMRVERELEQILIRRAKERSMTDPYLRRDQRGARKLENMLRQRTAEVLKELEGETNPKYQARPEWRHQSFPDLNIVGFIKTGTSHLYNVLATHSSAIADLDWKRGKEHCAGGGVHNGLPRDAPWKQRLFHWHAYFYEMRITGQQQRTGEGKKKVVNGCMRERELEYRLKYVDPPPDAKFFLIFRDPADWMWAAFNFFCDEYLEKPLRNVENGRWLNSTVNYRSPELFHEVVLSGASGSGMLLPGEFVFSQREKSISKTEKLFYTVGRENLMILKNEDLLPDRIVSSGLLKKISDFSGLPIEGFNSSILDTRSNCNANKGYSSACNGDGSIPSTAAANSTSSSLRNRRRRSNDHQIPSETLAAAAAAAAYPITHHRPMLAATRKLIYIQWYEECKIWAEEFGVVYPDCLNALSSS